MILHIIKKDLRLLWPFVVGLTALNVLVQWLRYGFSVYDNTAGWTVFGPIALLAWIVLVAVLVHQDVIPGTRQDWLTRPIKRRDLVAAKLLFVVALLHMPLFVMMTIEVLAAGYSLPDALGGALARSLSLFVSISLPTFALATITRNLIEAVIVAIVVAIASELAITLVDALANEPCGYTCGSSLSWIGVAARAIVAIVAMVVVIALQYFRRGATTRARGVVLVAAVAVVLAGRLSWSSAFEIQRAVTGAPAEPARVSISLAARQSAQPARLDAQRAAVLAARGRLAGQEGPVPDPPAGFRSLAGATISLPMRVDGQRAGTVLWADRVELRLLDAGGRVVYRGNGGELEIRAGTNDVVQNVFIPAQALNVYAGTELRAELDYWLTSLEESAAATLPAAGGSARLRSGEQCAARPLRAGDAVNVRCLTIHRPPACFTAGFEGGGADLLVCAPSYWPDALWGNLFGRFDVNVAATGGLRIDDAVLRIATYEPRDHFTAQVVVPQLRLADWVVAPPR